MKTRISTLAALVAVIGAFAIAPHAGAQDLSDRLSFHGSLNAGVAKADGAQYFGINKDWTSDYRAVALQFGYKLSDDDRAVVQLLHRQLGQSPLQAIEPAVSPIWAFYEHRSGDWTVKLGRAPLPRGLFNETRFIGTLLPFYRVGKDVYGETLENIDGAVISRRIEAGSWGIDANAFGGGFDLKALLPGATAVSTYKARGEQSVGASVIVRTPIEGVRFGAYAHDYQTLPKSTNPARVATYMYSADGNFTHAWLRGEYTNFRSHSSSQNAYAAWYGQGGIKVDDHVQFAVEHGLAHSLVTLPAPFPAYQLPFSEYTGIAANYSPNSSLRYKLEFNRQEGYLFDTPVPSFIPPTAPPIVMGLAPKTRSNYAIASVAVAF